MVWRIRRRRWTGTCSTIYNKANEMDRLINELTFYSKIDTNRIPYTFSKHQCGGIFSRIVWRSLGLSWRSRDIELYYANYGGEGCAGYCGSVSS